ncbi:MAG: hypothetical protein ACJAYU_004785 [Bradymonadia bacterium]
MLTGFYTAELVYSGLTHPGVDPATISEPGRSAYLWRVAYCGVLAPVCLGLLYWASGGREAAAWRMAQKVLIPTILVAAILSVIFA